MKVIKITIIKFLHTINNQTKRFRREQEKLAPNLRAVTASWQALCNEPACNTSNDCQTWLYRLITRFNQFCIFTFSQMSYCLKIAKEEGIEERWRWRRHEQRKTNFYLFLSAWIKLSKDLLTKTHWFLSVCCCFFITFDVESFFAFSTCFFIIFYCAVAVASCFVADLLFLNYLFYCFVADSRCFSVDFAVRDAFHVSF